MITYRIRDWSKHFENNRTRGLKELRFVILPNKHDGDGYTELLDHPNGAAHYGAWVSLVQVSSKGKHPAGGCGIPAGCCECRGILLRTGARPHDPVSLSRLTRIPASVYEEALPRLVKIEWLESEIIVDEEVKGIPHPPAERKKSQSRTPLPKSAGSIEGNGMEQKGMEEKEEHKIVSRGALASEVFAFWKEHLNHQDATFDAKRGAAIMARLKEGYTVEQLKLAIRGCKLSDFHMGREAGHPNVHDNLTLICRDAEHVDKFIAIAGKVNGTNKQNPGDGSGSGSDYQFKPKSVTR